MNEVKVFKALSNETRIRILQLLKDPEKNFPPQLHCKDSNDFANSVCVGTIKNKLGLSQSTISQFLSILVDAELLESKRIGQWTYFRRNEKTIKILSEWIGKEL